MSAAPALVDALARPHGDRRFCIRSGRAVRLSNVWYLVEPKPSQITPEQYGAIKRAVRGACHGKPVGAEDRFDLQQEIAIKLLEGECKIENLYVFARSRVIDLLRERALHLELEKEYAASGGDRPYHGRIRRDPHVSYMTLRPTASGINHEEDARIRSLDEQIVAGVLEALRTAKAEQVPALAGRLANIARELESPALLDLARQYKRTSTYKPQLGTEKSGPNRLNWSVISSEARSSHGKR